LYKISENLGVRTANLTEQNHSKALITLSMDEVSVLSNVAMACMAVAWDSCSSSWVSRSAEKVAAHTARKWCRRCPAQLLSVRPLVRVVVALVVRVVVGM
jgi:cob(I)alamin adenosyltransferase